MVSEMGVVQAFYSGLGPILLKQIPYTMAKFGVQQQAAEVIYNSLGTDPSKCSPSKVMTVSLSSGVIAGIVAATISQPADGLLARWVHVGTITAGQFAIVDAVMMAVGAKRFHFHKPEAPKAATPN